ncbi:acyl-CoA dehydrogenase family protein [Microbacterium resistens]|uniref:acyl-CoA dehydrogenase family protein n=1 Tax=Microbacterium resistens TaxID=156977 RepID=UPI00082AFCF4|nr:acyl-CoA dehydrogenase family protein [Microbacterium resistens]
MNFTVTEEQEELIELVRAVLAQRSDDRAMRAALESDAGYDTELWRLLCTEIGAASLAIPEEAGGAGFSTFETHLVLEELGRGLTPSPYLGSVAITAQAILATHDDEAAARLLPGLAEGTRIGALGWAAPDGRWDPERVAVTATPGEPWRVTGRVPLVLEGATADVLVVVANTADGARLFELLEPDAVRRDVTPAMDPGLRVATLHLEDVAARPLGDGAPDVLPLVLDHALTAVSALQSGTAARALASSLAYVGQRVQFGRPIGSFQAVKHRLADLHVRVETAATTTRAAARAVADGSAERTSLARLAKAWCSETLDQVAAEMIQLHGGIAITWEHDAHLVFKRAHALGQLFGTAAEQRARAADWALQPA